MSIFKFNQSGYVRLPYSRALRDLVWVAQSNWKAFCALPLEVKQSVPYTNKSTGTGYEYKDGRGKNGDKKENFDYSAGDLEWLRDVAVQINNPALDNLIQSVSVLNDVLVGEVVKFAKGVEESHDIPGFGDMVRDHASYFIRFIHYFGDRVVGEETASAHTDQSGFTYHLFESDPGLQGLGSDGEWFPMAVGGGETVVIPSMQLQLLSEGKLKALCHRVIATPKTANEGRYSAVCFIKLLNFPSYNKERFGRLQEKVPGFNYEMTHEDFAKLFQA